MGPKMGLLESAWPPAWLNLWLLTETCILPLVASLRGTLPTFQPCILPLPHDCWVTSQRPHIKCSLHFYRWAGCSIFWECPLLPPTFSCSPGTLLLTQKLGSGATSSGRSPLTSISPSLLPAKFIHSFQHLRKASLRCRWIKTRFCPHGSYILEAMRGIS